MPETPPDYCPPHKFAAAWQDDDKGVIFCRYCGEVRELEVQRIGAPDLEKVTAD